MKHTYFTETRDWHAEGTYCDAEGATFPLTGEVNVICIGKESTLGGYLEVAFNPPLRFENNYKITPVDEYTYTWESYNPELGTLRGSFSVLSDYILSLYVSEDGTFSGTEALRQVAPYTYENAGACFCKGVRLSSWVAVIRS